MYLMLVVHTDTVACMHHFKTGTHLAPPVDVFVPQDDVVVLVGGLKEIGPLRWKSRPILGARTESRTKRS